MQLFLQQHFNPPNFNVVLNLFVKIVFLGEKTVLKSLFKYTEEFMQQRHIQDSSYINLILHIGTNDALNLPPNEMLDKILELKKKIEAINKDYKVIISMPTYRFDNRKAGNNVNESTNML